ncbi:MAG: omega-6 fatty acid desaturase (delta-12 desaturase) [Verrucomicrobiales bacterium]|jgi:omega-6 fatty acid desaturase (delta-12 desaturase)
MNNVLVAEEPPVAEKPTPTKTSHRHSIKEWKAIVAEFEKPDARKATWQLVNSAGAYALLWAIMYFSVQVSWWLTIPLALLAGGLLVRVFIIFHDCGHGSFFKSKRANNFWGYITGMLIFTPYFHWRWEHSVHHASSGHLERRGVGDVWTLTVKEYLEASRWTQVSYRFVRSSFVLLFIAPLYLFVFRERFTTKQANPREKRSVYFMNLGIATQAAILISIFGFMPWFIIQLIAITVAATSGVWLFYVQHQFEDTYWEDGEEWDYTAAALEGSSFYKLPKVLQWFSGNIGFHHIHHLSSRIPNYHLERCHHSHAMFRDVKPMTIATSLKCITYRLWDQDAKKLIGFKQLKKPLQDAA